MSKRSNHQPPTRQIAHHEPSTDELTAACGSLAALVLARDGGTAPLSVVEDDGSVTTCDGAEAPRPLQPYRGKPVVAHTVGTLQACGIGTIEVSAAIELRDGIAEALATSPAAGGKDEPSGTRGSNPPVVTVTAYDPAAEQRGTLAHGKFEVFSLGFATLEQARILAKSSDAEAVLVLPGDLACLKPRHILQLAAAVIERTEAEVIASWAVWLNRPPYILRTSFLNGLPNSPRAQAGSNACHQPLPFLKVHEVVLGEDMVMATPPASNPESEFFGTCTLSALEAVRKIREKQREISQGVEGSESAAKRKAAAEAAAKRNAAYAGVSMPSGPSPSDSTLLQAAREVLEVLDAVRDELAENEVRADAAQGAPMSDGSPLDRWDAWARRNKLDFPIFNDREHKNKLVYLDSAATTQRVGRALDTQYHFDAHENANIYRGAYALSARATAAFNDARNSIEGHIGADRRSIAFTSNTSTAAGLVAQAWGERNIRAEDRILVSAIDHHSNLVPWLMLAQRKGAHLDHIPARADGTLDLDAYRALLKRSPKLVCLTHISNVLGIINPVEEMAKAARESGARTYLDAAQSFPHLGIDVRKLGVDFMGLSAHKAYGPLGIGCLWISSEAFEEMDPLVGGGGTVSHVGLDSYYLRSGTIQYELGTPPVSQAIGFAAAVEYLDELGMAAVEEHSATLTKYLVSALIALEDKLGGVRIWGDHVSKSGQTGLVSFSLTGIPAKSAASTLGKLGVCVRAGGHCALPLHASLGLTGSIRFSFGVHTTAEDIEAGLVALAICRQIYG